VSAGRRLRLVPPPSRTQSSAASERPPHANGLTVAVTIRDADAATADERRERQLRAIVRLLRRAAALQAAAKRAA
jgi:hypothetical protein